MAAVNARGAISPVEACAIHRDRVTRRKADIDPNVRVRIERGCTVTAADYIYMLREREMLARKMNQQLLDLDALVMPTTAIVAPTIAAIADPDEFGRCNGILLRNAVDRKFFRPVRCVVAASGRPAGRTHAACAQRTRPTPAADRRRRREAVARLKTRHSSKARQRLARGGLMQTPFVDKVSNGFYGRSSCKK